MVPPTHSLPWHTAPLPNTTSYNRNPILQPLQWTEGVWKMATLIFPYPTDNVVCYSKSEDSWVGKREGLNISSELTAIQTKTQLSEKWDVFCWSVLVKRSDIINFLVTAGFLWHRDQCYRSSTPSQCSVQIHKLHSCLSGRFQRWTSFYVFTMC